MAYVTARDPHGVVHLVEQIIPGAAARGEDTIYVWCDDKYLYMRSDELRDGLGDETPTCLGCTGRKKPGFSAYA